MQELIEFFEMVSVNDAILRGNEKLAILKARLALNAFERAMESFKRGALADASTPATAAFRVAA